MEFGGRYLFSADRPRVWQALNDAEVLKAAIPGCLSLDWTGSDSLELAIAVNLGVVHPVFHGSLILADVVPAERYRLIGRGKGGIFGKARGAADVTLSDREEGTELSFSADGGASNRLMQIGRALIGHSAQNVIDGFFARLAQAMGTEIVSLAGR